ncbi:MAG TPA: hypothetical protein VGH16_02505 [Candidatus Binatia bacterium]|jgi:hypothetical protein
MKAVFAVTMIFGLCVASPARAAESPALPAVVTAAVELPPPAPPLAALKECLARQAPGSDECLDVLFRGELEKHPPAELLKSVHQYEEDDAGLRLACHPVVHALGREIFRVKGNIHDAFLACDQTCHSGCYHGAVERFLRGDSKAPARHVTESEIVRKAPTACDVTVERRVYFQCLHGLGHALMFFTENDVDTSLKGCDALSGAWSQESCYGGVFMENVVSALSDQRKVSATDPQYPCNQVAEKYRRSCYWMQTSRMQEMGLNEQQQFDECAKAGWFAGDCAQSIGRDLSNLSRTGESATAAAACESVSDDARRACIRGAVYALIDNTWDLTYATPFCAALKEETAYCTQTSTDYLRTFIGK